MSELPFPPDVSVRIDGDRDAALALLPLARQMLYKALALQRNGNPMVRLRAPLPDGSLVQAVLNGTIKQLYITPAPQPTPTPQAPAQAPQPVRIEVFLNDMVSGLAVGMPEQDDPTIINIPDPSDPLATVPALQHFHPDAATAAAQAIAFDWQSYDRLGVDSSGNPATGKAACAFPKPSMYSGAMKRVVSAVLGLGHQPTETAEYISGDVPATYPDFYGHNNYDYSWLRTHGIHVSITDGSVWLVEISKDNGVLAMPLPTFEGTAQANYMAWLAARGDTDTLAVVNEFGGLPTGEAFPTGATLDAAIAAGKVLRLAAAADIAEFYHDPTYDRDKSDFFPSCGWAFNKAGTEAHNTCHWYSRLDIAFADPSVWSTDGFDTWDPMDRFMRAEHWKITLELHSDPTGATIGAGSCGLTKVSQGLCVSRRQYDTDELSDEFRTEALWQVPAVLALGSDTERLTQVHFFGRQSLTDPTIDYDAEDPPPCVYAYFGEDDTLEEVFFRGYLEGGSFGQGSFWSTNIDHGRAIYSSPSGPDAEPLPMRYLGLWLPAYVREGHVITAYETTLFKPADDSGGFTLLTDPVYLQTFARLPGFNTAVSFTPYLIAVPNGIDASNFIDYLLFWTCYTYVPRVYDGGVSLNVGPRPAFVANDGLRPMWKIDPPVYVTYGVDDFVVPAGTSARTSTFVGAVS